MSTFSGLLYITHGRVGTKSEGSDYHLQTSHEDYLLCYKERHPWEPDYHLEFFGRRMVGVDGKLIDSGVVQVENIYTICTSLIPQQGTPTRSGAFVNPELTSVAVITLDFQTFQLKNVYVGHHPPCSNDTAPIADEEFKARVRALFAAQMAYPLQPFAVEHRGDFVVLSAAASDFGGLAVFDSCSGHILHAGAIVWMGRGEQIYPTNPLPPETITRTGQPASAPTLLDVLSSPYAPPDGAEKQAWEAVADLNIIQEFATAPYRVLMYVYPRSVGIFDPSSADWVICVHRDPTGGP
ncbi:MAG: hypothetical protein U0350_50120 [Caldilineaceae bacterium]